MTAQAREVRLHKPTHYLSNQLKMITKHLHLSIHRNWLRTCLVVNIGRSKTSLLIPKLSWLPADDVLQMHLPSQSHRWATDVLSQQTRANLQSEDSHLKDRQPKMSLKEAQALAKDTTLRAMKSSQIKSGNLMLRSTLAVRSIWMHKIAHLTSLQTRVSPQHRRHSLWHSRPKWSCLKSCRKKSKMRSGRQTTRTWAHSQKVCLLKLF